MKPVRCVVNMPPSFIVVTEADGKHWLNMHRILGMRELPDGALIELDNGDVLKVTDKALDIALYLQRPNITLFIEDEIADEE
jgi:uncharacterized protein YlzI (FlbEa/FlbD family)